MLGRARAAHDKQHSPQSTRLLRLLCCVSGVLLRLWSYYVTPFRPPLVRITPRCHLRVSCLGVSWRVPPQTCALSRTFFIALPSAGGRVGVPGTCVRPAGHPCVRPQEKRVALAVLSSAAAPAASSPGVRSMAVNGPSPHATALSLATTRLRSVPRGPLCGALSFHETGARVCGTPFRFPCHRVCSVLAGMLVCRLLWWALLQPPRMSIAPRTRAHAPRRGAEGWVGGFK
jgi:hypothetical protein